MSEMCDLCEDLKAQRDALKVERDALEETANKWFLELVEVKKERDELRKIVSSECPVDALDIVNSLRVEKWHLQQRIKELEEEVERLRSELNRKHRDYWNAIVSVVGKDMAYEIIGKLPGEDE